MLIKLVILAALSMSSIMAALSQEEMADTLIAENEEDLVETFKKFEKEQDNYELSYALANVAKSKSTYLRLSLVLEQSIPSQLKCHM